MKLHSFAALYDETSSGYIPQAHDLTVVAVQNDNTETEVHKTTFPTQLENFEQDILINDTVKSIKIIWQAESNFAQGHYGVSVYDIKLYGSPGTSDVIL